MKRALLAAFPVTILAIWMAERIATYSLGAHPWAWAAWLNTRSFARFGTFYLTDAVGPSALAHIAVIVVMIAVVAALCLSRAGAVIVNHFALLYLLASVTVSGNHSPLAGYGMETVDSGLIDFNPAAWEVALLVFGALACVCSHWFFIQSVRSKSAILRNG